MIFGVPPTQRPQVLALHDFIIIMILFLANLLRKTASLPWSVK